MRYVDKRQPSNARPADRRIQRPDGASNAATPPAILEPDHRRIQRLGMAAYRNTAHNAAINRAHGWASKTAAHSWFSTNRIAAPNPDLPKLYSPAAVQDTATRANRWRHQATDSPDTGLSRLHPEARYHHLADRQPLDLQPHRRDPAVRHSGVWKHIASMVMPEVKALHPEWDSVPYQVKRTAVRDACRAMSNVKTFNLELKDSQTHGQRADETFAQLGYRSRLLLHTGRRRDGAWRLSHHSRTAADGRSHPGGAQRMPTGAGTRPVLAHRSLPGAMRH